MEKIILTSIDKSNQDLDMYTIAEWIANVNGGTFIDYDGFGYLVTNDNESNLRVRPSYVIANKITKASIDFDKPKKIKQKDIKQFTHIVWYNR